MAASQIFEWLHLDASAPAVKATSLPVSYYKFPPSNEPLTIPPPPDHPNLAHPFTIQPDTYNALLSVNVPITVALVYASVVTFLNSVNANRKYKPWAISRTRLFKLFVILHNLVLAAYSAWTFVGMVNALRLSLPAWKEGLGAAGAVDALCKLHGPRGHGQAVTYNATTSLWSATNRLVHLGADGLAPETSDVGRIWNEGLAFYGWIFYLSKFYEVLDTFIILAKGRKSSFLQTYHHAGAMLCMWAGIRYMSPPIWMFVLVNSAIHAIMYTFYLMSTIGVRVPKWFKQSLTTLQITQFVVGATYAFAHLFVAYQIPVQVPYIYHLGSAASSVLANAPSDISSVASSAISTASAGAGSWLKKIALRAAGHEGLAENVLNEQGRPFGIDAIHIAEDLVAKEETRYKDELQWVHCLDTSGQVFAILLNCLYLLPLTWLFAQFFITSYLKRVERRRSSTASDRASAARLSFRDASKGVARRLSEAVEEMHFSAGDIGDDTVLVDGDEIKNEFRAAVKQAKSGIAQGTEKLRKVAQSPNAEKVKQEVQRDLEKLRKNVQTSADNVVAAVKDPNKQQDLKAKAQGVKDAAAEATQKATNTVKSSSGRASQDVKASTEKTSGKSGQKPSEGEANVKTEQSSSSPEQPSPNGSGTGAGEATGSQSSQGTKNKKKGNDKRQVQDSEKGGKEKKKEDKIIDESQAVREKEVNPDTGASEKDRDSKSSDGQDTGGASEVREGTSFADAVKE